MAALAVGLAAVWTTVAVAAPIGAFTTKGAWGFSSAPNLHPPQLATTARPLTSSLAGGNFLLDNFPNVAVKGPMTGEGGPLIVNNRLQPVWFYPVGTNVASTDLQQETYEGQPVLVWWQGVVTDTGATTSGEVVVVDQHYRRIATLRAKAPWVISVHDASISGANIWVTVYRTVKDQNLTAFGGSADGAVYDSGVQEYNLKSGQLEYTWDGLNPGGTPNVPLSESEQPVHPATGPDGSWDAYHVNSVQVVANNEILVSMRNTWAAYLVNTASNQIIWTLGGKASSFKSSRRATFAWQHDVEMLPNGNVTMFDDDCCKLIGAGKFARPNGPSRGMLLSVNDTTHAVSLVAAYAHKPTLDAVFLGSMQVLPGGNALVGWGSPQPYFSEYSKSGKELLDVRWPGKDNSYRALYTNTWVGTPFYPPSGALRRAGANTTVYASWNGATQVAKWQVLAGTNAEHLRVIDTVTRSGFETAIALGAAASSDKAFEVRALDAKGHVLGTSPGFPTGKSSPLPPSY